MGKVRTFQRQAGRRLIGRKIIIACEGRKTEYGYFNAIRQSMRLPTLRVLVVRPYGTDPLTIVRTALNHKRERERERTWTKKDSAWAVFDGDEHKLENLVNWNNAIQLAERNEIRLAISNPCFEFWYLLHFRDHSGNLSRIDASRLLRQYIAQYEKADVLWPVPLQPLTTQAINRAKQLAARASANELEPHTNPCTGVCDLVESLLRLEQETRKR
jgi:hypothetical protein